MVQVVLQVQMFVPAIIFWCFVTVIILEEAMLVYSERGFRGFFAGCTCRAAWMGLGGFIFLGSFELAKTHGQVLFLIVSW